MQFETDLYNLLTSSTDVKNSVDTWVVGSQTNYMIFYTRLLPQKLETSTGTDNLELTVENKTINYYRISPITGGMPPHVLEYSASCRAYTQAEAETIQDAVYDILNRKRFNKSFFKADKLAIVPPADDSDNYNAPVTIYIKSI